MRGGVLISARADPGSGGDGAPGLPQRIDGLAALVSKYSRRRLLRRYIMQRASLWSHRCFSAAREASELYALRECLTQYGRSPCLSAPQNCIAAPTPATGQRQ